MTAETFSSLRYGMFVHFGLYSLLGRGEWALNRERIPPEDYRKLMREFNPRRFDAEALCQLAVDSGMRYLVFTTMHHDGFRLYHSDLTDFHVGNTPYGKDIVGEVVVAARRHGLGIGLYHSLNDWMDSPDGCDALEDPAKHKIFVERTHNRLAELVEKFKPIDVVWYDGWWPFHAEGWRAEEMNARLRAIQPSLLFNGRNGLAGDFATPEQHLSTPAPWRPWEACVTLNDSWGFHSGDHNWKSPREISQMLARTAAGKGNLLLNIGPDGNGAVPSCSEDILRATGSWIATNAEAIYDVDVFTFDYRERGNHRSDWTNLGIYTASDNRLYFWLFRPAGNTIALGGIQTPVQKALILGGDRLEVRQTGDRTEISGLPEPREDRLPHVIRMDCKEKPSVYITGGMRIPRAPHPPYDPCPSDLAE